MKLPFRQGIVRCQTDLSNNPSFLQKVSTGVNLLTTNGPLVLSFTHGGTEYSHTENSIISNAWTAIFQPSVTYILYIDLDVLTGERTFGFTSKPFTTGPTAPTSPENDQHWFDSINFKMKVWNQSVSSWVEKIRIFVARVVNSTIEYTYPIGNSQVGISRNAGTLSTYFPSGRILYADGGAAVRKVSGEFFTSEDKFYVGGSRIDAIRLESNVIEAIADQNISAFSIVRFNNLGKIVLANYADIGNTIVAIVTGDVLVGQAESVIIQGAVTNPLWKNAGWSINDKLWVKDNGEIVNQDPNESDFVNYPVKQVPIARVLRDDTIIFEQGLGGVGKTGPAGSGSGTNASVNPATDTEFGTVKLLTPTASKIVVSTDDPRLAGGPYASQIHTHTAEDVSVTPVGDITAPDLQAALGQISSLKLSKAGDTMTGPLVLSGNPTGDLHAASKGYVDALVNGLVWQDPIQYVNLIADNILTAPAFPNYSDIYVIPSGATGTWSSIGAGHLTQWDGNSWQDLGLLSSLSAGTRFGVSMESSAIPGGSFVGQSNSIAVLDNPTLGTWSFIVPTTNTAVLVNNLTSLHAWHQYVYTGTAWVEFAGPSSVLPGNNLTQNGNVLDVKNYGAGGTVDARYLQGLQPVDFLLKTGGTLTGALTLSGAPTVDLHAATKKYVDDTLAGAGGGGVTDPLHLNDNNVTTPTYSFTSSTGTGMYISAPNTLGFAVAGNQILSVSAVTGLIVNPGSGYSITLEGNATQADIVFENLGFMRSVGNLYLASGNLQSINFGIGDTSTTGFNSKLSITSTNTIVYNTFTAAGQSLAGGGTALLPGFGFDGDNDTGIFSDVAGEVAVTSNGTEIARVSSSGVDVSTGSVTASNFTRNTTDLNVAGYKHTQSAASSAWAIAHNLNTEFVNVSVYIDSGGSIYEQLIPTSVIINDANNLTINFSTTRIGRAVIVGVL